MPGQGGPVGHVGGVWQAQRLLYGRRGSRVLVAAGAPGLSAACTSTSAAEVPALAVAGLDGSIAAPARDESAWFAAAPRAAVAAVRGVWAEREPAHRRCMSIETAASPERVMAKPRAVSSSSARAGTRTATVLRSLSLPPGAGASSPRAHFAGVSHRHRSARLSPESNSAATIASARPRPTVPDQSRRRWASAGGRLRLASAVAAPGRPPRRRRSQNHCNNVAGRYR